MTVYDDFYDRNKKNEYNAGRNIITADAATILQNIKQSAFGDHNLVIYFSLEEFEEIYIESSIDALLNRNELFLLATYYQDVGYVRKKLRLAGIDIAKYERENILVITDSAIAYQRHTLTNDGDDNNNSYYNDAATNGTDDTTYNIIKISSQLVRHAEKVNKNGVTILGDVGPFILKNKLDELIRYEESISPLIANAKVRLICCYHKDDFDRLTEEQRQKILAVHGKSFIVSLP